MRVVLLEPEHPGERGHHRRAILRVDPERHQARRELAHGDLDGIAVLHPVGVAQERGRRSVGPARPAPSMPRAGSWCPRGGQPPRGARRTPAAAATSRTPGSPMRLSTWARPARMSSKAASIRRQLALAGRRRARPARGPRGRGRSAGPRASPARDRPHRLALALEPDLLARGEREGVVRELIRRVGYQDLARRRRALQARGGVDGVAGHRVGGVGGRADPARHHRAGIDLDVQRERPPHPPLPAEIQRAHPVAHQESARAGRVRDRPRARAGPRRRPSPHRPRTSRRSPRSARSTRPSRGRGRPGSRALPRDRVLR